MSKKILIITHHRKDRSPGQRFRFEQYINFIEQQGISFDWDILLTKKDDEIFYSHKTVLKFWLIIKLFFKRLNSLKKVKNYDGIFIFREVFVIGGAFFEKRIARINPNIIFDFDDAIWLQNVSTQNKKFKWLKKPKKTEDIIKVAKIIITGNHYLANYAKQFNKNVIVIPTTIDTNYHKPLLKKETHQIVIGWTGSSSTLPYFEKIVPELKLLKEKYTTQIGFKIIVDVEKFYPELNTQTTLWSLVNEVQELNTIDIGIMPLPNDEWAKGKCGFKGLQYMSLGIPTIMSPVGVNTEIINDGENGFLAETPQEWIEKISLLIERDNLRKRLGKNGQQTIITNYSVEANKEKYLRIFKTI